MGDKMDESVDYILLKLLLNESIVSDTRERFGLNWSGKADCFKIIQKPTTATLRPYSEESIDFDKVRRLDMEFHLTIVRSAQNQFLNQTLGTLQEIMYRSMDNTLKLPGRIDKSEHEHGMILEAIEAGDAMKARLSIIQHIHNARDGTDAHRLALQISRYRRAMHQKHRDIAAEPATREAL